MGFYLYFRDHSNFVLKKGRFRAAAACERVGRRRLVPVPHSMPDGQFTQELSTELDFEDSAGYPFRPPFRRKRLTETGAGMDSISQTWRSWFASRIFSSSFTLLWMAHTCKAGSRSRSPAVKPGRRPMAAASPVVVLSAMTSTSLAIGGGVAGHTDGSKRVGLRRANPLG